MAKQKKKFDWEVFNNEHVAVHLKTEKEAREFSRILHQHGYRWRQSGSCLNYPHCSRMPGRLCFYSDARKYLLYGSLSSANEEGIEIRMFSAYDFSE